MADPLHSVVPTPESNLDGNESLNYIARSALRIMRRTERSLSPWTQRIWQASPSNRAAQTTPVAESSADHLSNTPFRSARESVIAGRMPLALSNRVQRLADNTGVTLAQPSARVGLSSNRLAAAVVQRFPDIARKYESRPAAEPSTVQRSALAYGPSSANAPAATEQFETRLPSGPEFSQPEPDFPDADQSMMAQLTARLQGQRSASHESSPFNIQPASPRQISRKANEVAAARGGERLMMRRAQVEEIGSKPEALARPPESPTQSVNATQSTPKSIHRKESGPATVKAKEFSPPARPTSPRRSALEPAWASEPDPFQAEWKPGLPSITQELTQRYMAQRSLAEATPKPPKNDEDDLPSWLRKDAPAQAASTPKPAGVSSNSAQRKPEIQRKPVQPARVEPPASASPKSATIDQPPAPVTQKTAPTLPIQREAETRPDSKSETEPTDPDQPKPTRVDSGSPAIQRSPKEVKPAAIENGDLPLQRKVVAVEAPQLNLKSDSLPGPALDLKTAPLQVQRRVVDSESPAVDPAESTPPTIQREVAATLPEQSVKATPSTIQREAAPPSMARRLPPEPNVGPEPRQPDPIELAQPTGVTRPHSIQRQTDLPLHTQPPAPQPDQSSQRTEPPKASSLGETVLTRVQSSAKFPLSQPAAVQRKTVSPSVKPASLISQRVADQDVAPRVGRTTRSPLPLATQPVLTQVQHGPRAERVQRQVIANTPEVAPLFSEFSAPTVAVKPAPTTTLQRTVAPPARAPLPLAKTVSRTESRVQRVESAPESSNEDAPRSESSTESGPDLLTLARQIYPLLKRMLAVERERR